MDRFYRGQFGLRVILMMQPKDKIQLVYCCARYDSLHGRMKSWGKSLDVSGSRVLVRRPFPKPARIKSCSNLFAVFISIAISSKHE